jgi:hypothetical protein
VGIVFKDQIVKNEFERIKLFFLLQYFLIVIILISEKIYHGLNWTELLVSFTIISLLARMTYKSLTKLYYSFWTFHSAFLVINLFKMVKYFFQDKAEVILILGACNILILLYNSYMLFSPVYFPFTRWWIYDFRLRYDLEVRLKRQIGPNLEDSPENQEGRWLEGRVTDIRRGYGCLNIFEKLVQGETVELKFSIEEKAYQFSCVIISAREYSFGRGYISGIRFLYQDSAEKKRLHEFFQKWKWRKLIVKGRSLKTLKKSKKIKD